MTDDKKPPTARISFKTRKQDGTTREKIRNNNIKKKKTKFVASESGETWAAEMRSLKTLNRTAR